MSEERVFEYRSFDLQIDAARLSIEGMASKSIPPVETGQVIGVIHRSDGRKDFVQQLGCNTPSYGKLPSMKVCEIMGVSRLSFPTVGSRCQIITAAAPTMAGALRWDAIACRRPRPGKSYRRSPESILIGHKLDCPDWFYFTRTFLNKLFARTEVDQIFGLMHTALHSCPPRLSREIRDCDLGLRERMLGKRSANKEFGEPIVEQPISVLGMDSPIFMNSTDALSLSSSGQHLISQLTHAEPEDEQAFSLHADSHVTSVGKTTIFNDLPAEIIDMIVDVLFSDVLLVVPDNSGEKQITARWSFASKALMNSTLRCLQSHEFVLCWKAWNMVPGAVYILQRAGKIRIDFSEVLQHNALKLDEFIQWLQEVWRKANALTTLTFYVPPAYESLPDLQPDTQLRKSLSPLIASLPDVKVIWDSSDFSNGHLTPLALAVLFGSESNVRLVLPKSRECLNRNLNGSPPILYAVSEGHHSILRLLLEADGLDVNARDVASGSTPLILATIKGDHAAVDMLLKHTEVQLDARDINGKTALQHALEQEHQVTNHALENAYHSIVALLRARSDTGGQVKLKA